MAIIIILIVAINCRFTASTVRLRGQEWRQHRPAGERARLAALPAAQPSQTPKRQSTIDTWPGNFTSPTFLFHNHLLDH